MKDPVFLGYDTASMGNWIPKDSSRFFCDLSILQGEGSISLETSRPNYQFTRRFVTEEHNYEYIHFIFFFTITYLLVKSK